VFHHGDSLLYPSLEGEPFMSLPWLSTPILRLITNALLVYAAALGVMFLSMGLGSNGSIGTAGVLLLGLLFMTALLGALGMWRMDGPDERPRRRLLLNIASMMAAGVALLALFGPVSDILMVSLPMLVLCGALHFVDRRYLARLQGGGV
jgi:hypothetical protein